MWSCKSSCCITNSTIRFIHTMSETDFSQPIFFMWSFFWSVISCYVHILLFVAGNFWISNFVNMCVCCVCECVVYLWRKVGKRAVNCDHFTTFVHFQSFVSGFFWNLAVPVRSVYLVPSLYRFFYVCTCKFETLFTTSKS